jgi:hypothetical protein
MLRKVFIAAALAAAPLAHAQLSTTPQPITPTPMSPGAASPAPGATTGSPAIPSTGAFSRPGDTTLPGSATAPGLSTLPGVNDRSDASAGSSSVQPPADALRLPPPAVTSGSGVLGPAPSAPGVIGGSRPGCIPGSLTNPC